MQGLSSTMFNHSTHIVYVYWSFEAIECSEHLIHGCIYFLYLIGGPCLLAMVAHGYQGMTVVKNSS